MAPTTFVLFQIETQVFALPANAVRQVIRAVAPSRPLKAPPLLSGIINMGGRPIALVNIRKQFGLPERGIRPSDRILMTESSGYPAAFAVDSILDVCELEPLPFSDPERIYPGMARFMAGMATYGRHTVLIHDIATLIPAETIQELNRAVETAE